MSPLDRSEKFQIRLTPEERKMLEAIAERDGLSASDKLRQLVRQDHAQTNAIIAGESLSADELASIFALPKSKVLKALKTDDVSEKIVRKLRGLASGTLAGHAKKKSKK